MESEETALLRTIRTFPHDDTPRLVYADWLEEHNHPERAEFIRVQCSLASAGLDDPERPTLELRERRLWQKYGGRWRAELPSRLRRYPFHRGFVQPHEMELTGQQFMAVTEELLDACPQWSVKLLLGPDDPLLRTPCPAIERLVSLTIVVAGVEPRLLEDWLGNPDFKNIRSLHVEGHPFGISHVWGIASSSAFSHLRRLRIFCNHIGAEGAGLIAESKQFAELEQLDLNGCGIGDAGVRILAESATLSQLQVLNLQHNGLDTDTAAAIIASRHLRQLRYLGLYGNHLGDTGTRLLSFGKNLGQLRGLDLGLNRIGPDGARALVGSPYLWGIRHLYLGGNRLGGTTVLDELRNRFGDSVTV